MDIKAILYFGRGYIGDPYWPAKERLIALQKDSGMNRVRSAAKREQALSDYLSSHNMTIEDYNRLVVQADQPFYRARDVGEPTLNPDEIVIPAHQLYGALANASANISKALRIATPEQIRTVMRVSNFRTGRTREDGVWSRFAVVTAGTGNKLSNMRALRESKYIADFTAYGVIHYLGDDEKRLRDFVEWTGREIGVGASRKMAWGRFEVRGWERIAARWSAGNVLWETV